VGLKQRRLALWIVGTVAFLAIVVQRSWSGNDVTTNSVVSFLVVGVSLGSIYALASSGIVVTYTTSGIFNFAQGAIGMFMAFVYWQLRVHQNLPTPVALFVTVLVIAPLFGAGIERGLMRRLADHTLVVQLVVTVGLMFGLMGLANTIWDSSKSRYGDMTAKVQPFFGTDGQEIADTFVTYHRMITIGTAIAVAILLRLLLYRTRIGVAMRAVVDNRNLAALNGARPGQASMLAWALGSSLAAISGILLVPELGLQVDALTLLIINAFAAAIVGRLRNLPLTYVGGVSLGLAISFTQHFLDLRGRFVTAQFAIPSIFLFIFLLALPQARIELRKLPPSWKILQPRNSKVWETAAGMAVLFVVMALFTADMGQVNLNRLTLSMAIAVIMLSLVPLTGWAGQVSLAQITFAGVGAFAMWKFTTGVELPLVHWSLDLPGGSPFGLLFAAALAVPFGVLMALPALRLQGLYLALASMAFARMAEPLFFDQPEVFAEARRIQRPSVFGYEFTDQRRYLLLVTAIFGALAVGLVALRRSQFGRRMIALRDSEAACATVGINRTTTKLAVFAFSAALAGFGGALLGMQRQTATNTDFQLLGTLGLPIVLLVVVGGVACVSGALFGGLAYILFLIIKESVNDVWHITTAVILGVIVVASVYPRLKESMSVAVRLAISLGAALAAGLLLGWFLIANFDDSWLVAIERLGPALLAINIATNPNGAAVGLGFLFSPLLPWRKDARQAWKDELAQRAKLRASRAAVRAARKAPLPAAPATAGVPPSGEHGEGVPVPAGKRERT
jgi:branched-chain amino acid transport system permease protein